MLFKMRFGQTLAVGLALNAALAAGVQAGATRPGGTPGGISVSSGPYSAILARNIFDLQKPGKIAPVTEKPPVLPNVKLIGLFQVNGHPQAVFSISEPGTVGKTPIPCIMSVNQMQSGVEVKAIDLVAKSARIQMGENISVIPLEEPKGTTGGVSIPAGPGMGAGPRPPGYPPNRPAGFVNGPAGFSNPSLPGAYNPNAGGDPNAAVGGMGDTGAIPNRQVRTDQPVPIEQQVQNIEAQRQQLLDAGQSDLAGLLPLTSASPQDTVNRTLTPGTSAQNPNSQGQQQPNMPQQPQIGVRATGTLRLPGQ
jgi:hypothetical protein